MVGLWGPNSHVDGAPCEVSFLGADAEAVGGLAPGELPNATVALAAGIQKGGGAPGLPPPLPRAG